MYKQKYQQLKKFKKPVFAICILAFVGFVAYDFLKLIPEEWQNREGCAECGLLEDGEMQRLIGRIEAQPNNKMHFIELETGETYSLIPCDVNCDNYLNGWFKGIGVVDFNNEPFYFDIEGKLDTIKQEFLLLSVVFLGPDRAIGKLIAFEGGNKIHIAKFIIIDPINSSLHKGDTINLGYYNYHEPEADIDTAMLTFVNTYQETSIKNYYICPDYNGQKGVRRIVKE